METYTLRSIQSMLGMSRAVITGLVASGFVAPTRGPRNEYRFTFQDVVLLRTAYSLRAARVPPRRILRSLRRLRESLPPEMPLSGLRIAAVGSEVAVQEGNARRHVETGQLLFDFDVQPLGRTIGFADRPDRAAASTEDDAHAASALGWFEHGVALEEKSRSDAESAYRRAIALEPDYLDPYLNLGVMLCDVGRCADAVALYGAALQRRPGEALLHFNLAFALEDLGRREDALEHYATCLKLEPTLADAHYNAARLHEQLGHRSQAIRHYSEYRRLQR